jgi:hypothetical protein
MQAEEAHALNGAWRLVLWPPQLDPDPRFWAASIVQPPERPDDPLPENVA